MSWWVASTTVRLSSGFTSTASASAGEAFALKPFAMAWVGGAADGPLPITLSELPAGPEEGTQRASWTPAVVPSFQKTVVMPCESVVALTTGDVLHGLPEAPLDPPPLANSHSTERPGRTFPKRSTTLAFRGSGRNVTTLAS